jgi:plastocyanin
MSRRCARRVPVGVRRACLLLALGLLLAACGGGGGGTANTKTATGGRIDVNAFDPFRFDVKTINASPGPLTITLHEKGSQEHTFTISSAKFEIKVFPDHPEATGTVTLAAGTYSFKCSFDGHAAAGMVGKIVVG